MNLKEIWNKYFGYEEESGPNYDYYYHSFVETFVQEQYKWIAERSRGLLVYDFGAQAGDSVIYLLQHGAKFVFYYEPDAEAVKELGLNLAKANKEELVDGLTQKAPEPFKPIDKFRNEKYTIKCDIEGGEHKVFTKNANLDGCVALQVEYHHGPQELPEILKVKGFKVKVDKPWTINNELEEVGWIYAWR